MNYSVLRKLFAAHPGIAALTGHYERLEQQKHSDIARLTDTELSNYKALLENGMDHGNAIYWLDLARRLGLKNIQAAHAHPD